MLSRTRSLAIVSGLALALSACGGSSDSDSAAGPTIEVEDNNGTQQVPQEPSSVVATDDRTFETLADWDVELSAAAVSLMPDTIEYTKNTDIVDLGTHREPDLEAIVAAKPDLTHGRRNGGGCRASTKCRSDHRGIRELGRTLVPVLDGEVPG